MNAITTQMNPVTFDLISTLPITFDQARMEEWARMDYITTSLDEELYATFVNVCGELVRVTEYKPFEEAWEDYNFIFSPWAHVDPLELMELFGEELQ